MDARTRTLLDWIHAPTQVAATDAVLQLAGQTTDYHEVYVPGDAAMGLAPEYVPSDVYHGGPQEPWGSDWDDDRMPEVDDAMPGPEEVHNNAQEMAQRVPPQVVGAAPSEGRGGRCG